MEQALPQIFVTKSDYERLASLAHRSKAAAARELEEELERAVVVGDDELPSNVVTMNSTIEFRNLSSNTTWKVKLVYPELSGTEADAVSILAPVGIALLGLRVNDVIEWPMPGGFKRRLQVMSIESRKKEPAL